MAEELSMIINSPGENEMLREIIWNKEEFMEFVASVTEQYDGLVYTEGQIQSAKEDRAKLNAMKKAISDRRIEVKKMYTAPLDKFEQEVKEVVALIEKPVQMIDQQIKEYEEVLKEEKKSQLVGYFKEIAEDLDGILTFDMIYDGKWMNTSVSLKKAKEEIVFKVEKFRTDINTITQHVDEKYRLAVKSYYIRTLDISKALAEGSRLVELDRRMEEEAERNRREAEEAEARRLEEE